MALAVGAANAVPVAIDTLIDGFEGIGDRVWNDLNMNGIQEAGEPGIGGVQVNLLNSGATVIATATTGGAGEYYFLFDDQGDFFLDYFVEFVLPADFVFSPQDIGLDETLDSDANVVTGLTAAINLTSSVDVNLDIDAGMYSTETPVPAPAALSLLGAGLAALGYRQRKRTRKR